MTYNLSDQIIAEVSRLLQVAILTGTDVVDNLRLLEVQDDPDQEGILVLTDAYTERAENNINKMLSEAKGARGEDE
tara:strand:- start:2074 stop:2301 length:228 start_codon:yes stop_codon:yes gene_type:complete